MNTPPDMTIQQSAELKALRRDEASKLKAVTRLEKKILADILKAEKAQNKTFDRLERDLRAAKIKSSRETAAIIKPLRAQLHRLNEGRVPEASALAAIRKRIAILEQRLTS